MPIQIKKEAIDKSEKVNRIIAIIALVAALVFIGLMISLLPSLTKDESPWKASFLATGYLFFTVSCILHFITAFMSYKKTQSMVRLFQGILSLLSSFMCLINLRFMLVMVFSAFKMDSVAESIVGGSTMTQFVQSQNTNWICLVYALVVMIVLGILGIVKLSRK